jgi:hypothetical protein
MHRAQELVRRAGGGKTAPRHKIQMHGEFLAWMVHLAAHDLPLSTQLQRGGKKSFGIHRSSSLPVPPNVVQTSASQFPPNLYHPLETAKSPKTDG